MARSPRLTLSRRNLRLAIGACDLAIRVRSEVLAAAVTSDAEAQAEFMALRDELSPRQRLFHPVARRARRARLAVLHGRRDIRELKALREKLQAVLEKEIPS
jgi:hypothetical protein